MFTISDTDYFKPDSPNESLLLLDNAPPGLGYSHCILLNSTQHARIHICKDDDPIVVKSYITNETPYSVEANSSRHEAHVLIELANMYSEFFLPVFGINSIQLFEDIPDAVGWSYRIPYCHHGNLEQRKNKSNISTNEVIFIAISVAHLIWLTHLNGVIHGDIKPTNLLYWTGASSGNGDIRITLTDFGSATRLTSQEQPIGRTGTCQYMSPEAQSGCVPATSDDIWAWGVMLLEILLDHRGFSSLSPYATDDLSMRLKLANAPQCLHDLLLRALHPVAASRPSAEDILATLLIEYPIVPRIGSDCLSIQDRDAFPPHIKDSLLYWSLHQRFNLPLPTCVDVISFSPGIQHTLHHAIAFSNDDTTSGSHNAIALIWKRIAEDGGRNSLIAQFSRNCMLKEFRNPPSGNPSPDFNDSNRFPVPRDDVVSAIDIYMNLVFDFAERDSCAIALSLTNRLTKALDIKPADLTKLGLPPLISIQAELLLGNPKNAQKLLRNYLDTNPMGGYRLATRVSYTEARCFAALEKYTKALDCLERCVYLAARDTDNAIDIAQYILEACLICAASNNKYNRFADFVSLAEQYTSVSFILRTDIFILLQFFLTKSIAEDAGSHARLLNILLSGRYFTSRSSIAKLWLGCVSLDRLGKHVLARKFVSSLLHDDRLTIAYNRIFCESLKRLSNGFV